MTKAERSWAKFMEEVEKKNPPSKEAAGAFTNGQRPHGYIKNFLGSVEGYYKLFLKANEPDKSTWID